MNNKNTIFVGIIEREQPTIDLLKSLLITFDYQLSYCNTKENIMILNKDRINLVVISMKPDEVEVFQRIGVEFNFLIINIINQSKKENFLQNHFRQCDYYIINSDEDHISILSLESLDGLVITYGFNSKATMTISSYIIEQTTEASLCLQREIVTLSGERAVSFEFIVEINSKNKDHIYSVLASSILVLLLGEKIQFKNTLRI